MDRRAQIKQWLREVLENNLSGITYSAFIFGSQANHMVLSRSDIDIGIMTDKPIPDEKLAQISDAIEELPMLYKIDIVDFNKVGEPFRSVALSNTEPL